MESKCHVCENEVGDAHECVGCKRPVHSFCGTGIGDEGYGQIIHCKTCESERADTIGTSSSTADDTNLIKSADVIYVEEDTEKTVVASQITSQTIPQHLWDMIPPKGAYLIEIMGFCGYDTVDSVVLLKQDTEVEKMFNFIREMEPVIDDKEKTLGIFSRLPQHLQILPGLKWKFNQFLDEVEKLKRPKVLKDNRKRKKPQETKMSDKKVSKKKEATCRH